MARFRVLWGLWPRRGQFCGQMQGVPALSARTVPTFGISGGALRFSAVYAVDVFLDLARVKALRGGSQGSGGGDGIGLDEVKRILRLTNVEALKKRLEAEGKEFITHSELLEVCRSMGVAQSDEEATEFAKALDAAGVILIFRNNVYLHPNKVAELVMKAFPLALASEDDPRKEELERLQKEKEEIDKIANRHVRILLWTGLAALSIQTALFFRLTFWEFSWDVMEPITFFTTTIGLLVGYMYFLFTSRDPTYHDIMTRLFFLGRGSFTRRETLM